MIKSSRAISECPICSSKYNSKAEGGNEFCFHCICGWIQCGDPEYDDDESTRTINWRHNVDVTAGDKWHS